VKLSPAEWAVLGAVAEGPTHGFAVSLLLASTGPLGRVWVVPRSAVYAALKKLQELRLISAQTVQASELGPARTIMKLTPPGRRAVRTWLMTPVDRARDVRSLLLLKLALLDRADADPLPLLHAERRTLLPRIAALRQLRDESVGFERILADWRLASTEAALTFVDATVATLAAER